MGDESDEYEQRKRQKRKREREKYRQLKEIKMRIACIIDIIVKGQYF